MKKILLATALAVCAGGVASAQNTSVTLTGEGKLGLSYSKAGVAGSSAVTDTISAANVKFTLSGKTEQVPEIGVFGASFTLDASEKLKVDGNEGTLSNPFTVYVGSPDGTLGKIEAGDDLGAADKKSGGLSDPGLNGIGVDDIAEAYYGGSGKKLRYEKALAGAALAISVDLDDAWAIGGGYDISDQLTIGAGYDQNEVARDDNNGVNEQNTMSFGMIGSMNQFSAAFLYSSRSTTVPTGQALVADKSAYGVEFGYEIGATTFTASYAQNDEGGTADGTSGWGVGMSHDLGGNLSFKAGFGNVDDKTVANLGFLMGF